MSYLRSPAGQASLTIGILTALLIGTLATLSLPSLAAWALIVVLWIAAVAATLLSYRLTGFKGTTKGWPLVSLAALVIVIALVVVTVKVLEGALGVRPASVIGAALSGGLTFGSAAVIGVLPASFLAKRKAEQAPNSSHR